MFNLLDVHLILNCLDQFYSLFNLILILKFHKIIPAPLLGASSTRPKQSSSYSSNCNFYCSGLGVDFFHVPLVCYFFFSLYVAHFPMRMMMMMFAYVWSLSHMKGCTDD
jgi:hypothetical protein